MDKIFTGNPTMTKEEMIALAVLIMVGIDILFTIIMTIIGLTVMKK